MVVVTYSWVAPLLMPFGVLFYAFAYVMYKYQLLYVYINTDQVIHYTLIILSSLSIRHVYATSNILSSLSPPLSLFLFLSRPLLPPFSPTPFLNYPLPPPLLQSGGYMWYAVFNRSLIALLFASFTLLGTHGPTEHTSSMHPTLKLSHLLNTPCKVSNDNTSPT